MEEIILRQAQANAANLRLAGVGCSAACNPFSGINAADPYTLPLFRHTRGERRGHARVQSPPISQAAEGLFQFKIDVNRITALIPHSLGNRSDLDNSAGGFHH